ncbi:MAG: hypothetical protein EA369_07395 [Bradymonadales bacterium]|nr:MAG: hypothetical protein EA369_07395 [Bradymonadales bacterium]
MKFNAFEKLAFQEEKRKRSQGFESLTLEGLELSSRDLSDISSQALELLGVKILPEGKLRNLQALSGSIRGLQLVNCEIFQSNLTEINCQRAFAVETIFDLVYFSRCKLQASDFRNARFVYSSLQECEAVDNDFSFSQWKSVRFIRSSIFHENLWSQAMFSGCLFLEIDFSKSESLNFQSVRHSQFFNCDFRSDQREALEGSNLVSKGPPPSVSLKPSEAEVDESSLERPRPLRPSATTDLSPSRLGRFSAIEVPHAK